MGQSRAELQAAFNQVKRLHADGRLRSGPAGALGLRITTVDDPDEVPFEAVERLVDYADSELGLQLSLVGGGIGCFDLRFAAAQPSGDALCDAVVRDPALQAILNEMRAHVLRVRTSDNIRSFAGKTPLKALLTTTRALNPSGSALDELFGAAEAATPSYGAVDFLITDFSRKQVGLAKRVWRKVTLGLGGVRTSGTDVELTRFDLLDKASFDALAGDAALKGVLACVHGYANSFAQAVVASARVAYHCRLDQLELIPLIFSWPSAGNFVAYQRDTAAAQASEIAFEELLRDLAASSPDKKISVLAHSHGNQLMLRSVCAAADGLPRKFDNLIMVAPDVDLRFFAQRLGKLAKAAARITVYHSSADRALGTAKLLAQRPRLGADGSQLSAAGEIPGGFEVIDATVAAKGLLSHSPHLDSTEVVRDIHDVLQGIEPAKRMSLEREAAASQWRIRRSAPG